MKEKVGEVFSINKENRPIGGFTISKEVYPGIDSITYFSLAKNTDISAEIYSYHKLVMVAGGIVEVYGFNGESLIVQEGECVITPINLTVGIRTREGGVYIEILLRSDGVMNEKIKVGELFKLVDLVPYQEGKIVNMDVIRNDKMKFVVMAFDEGTGLSEHAAPGEALIFALDGEGIIGYEGVDHHIKAGENFHFAKNGGHYVKAEKRFKMALLLILE